MLSNKFMKEKYLKTESLDKIVVPINGISRTEYLGQRINIESEKETTLVYVLSSGMLAHSMPEFRKKYNNNCRTEIIRDLSEYFGSKNFNKNGN